MGFCKKLFLAIAAMFVLVTLHDTYNLLMPPLCEKKSKFCLRPLFSRTEKFDLYVYGSQESDLSWKTPQGALKLLNLPLLYNRSAIGLSENLRERVKIPEAFINLISKNETFDAHVFLVRHGLPAPDSGTHKRVIDRRNIPMNVKRMHPQVEYLDCVYVGRAPVVRHMAFRRVNSSFLLGGEELVKNGNAIVEEETGGMFSVSHLFSALESELPRITLLLFALTSIMNPTVFTAAFRMCLLALFLSHYYQGITSVYPNVDVGTRSVIDVMNAGQAVPKRIVPHLRPSLRINYVADDADYSYGDYKAPILYHSFTFKNQAKDIAALDAKPIRYSTIDLSHVSKGHGRDNRYGVESYIEDVSLMKRQWIPMDTNITSEKFIEIEFNPISRLYFSVLKTFEEILKVYGLVGFTEDDMDELKWVLFRRPIHVLVLMQVVGFVQVTLSTLAFKNDVAFFKGRSDYAGLSSRSLATDAVHSIVIFLYVYDFENASRIVLFQLAVGALIDSWKVKKRMHIELVWVFFLPWLNWKSDQQTAGEKTTEEIDEKGMRYLKMFLYPLSVVWGGYCLWNYQYKSWWSWFISSLADFAYTFGFLNMMPQIFVNYKLKSVAHMPWRVLIYKVCFDVFPTLYRFLTCLGFQYLH
mmetsp:Transcript_4384/g.5884  ORF Transcript_4384/g.5884 Transcript_4384/m.5884 type:complete len:639 (+) Transcript_4384:74-1990(+)